MNNLAKKYTFLGLLKFATPTILMMIFMSLYTMVDGIFVSRLIGTSALSAVNIVYPIYNFVIAIGIMLATGGSAVIAKKLGEGRFEEAKSNFSFITFVGFVIGLIILTIGLLFIEPILRVLGASESIFQLCKDYAIILLWFTPLGILQMLYQFFFVTAGKPNIGLVATIIGGVLNMVLDYVFIVPMSMGIGGAALATGIGMAVPGIFGSIYFFIMRKGSIFFVKPKLDFKMLLKTCINGSSEMVTNLSIAITTFLFNIIMMKYLGENGVAAITIVLYSQFLLTALFLGYSSGVAPIFSFNYGMKNKNELRNLYRISMIFVIISSICMYILSMLLTAPIVTIFAKEGTEVFYIAKNGFILFAISYLFTGVNIFVSSLFTSLSNGKVSAIISFLRTFLFLVAAILTLPLIIGINGIWLSVPVAELIALIICIYYLVKYKKIYFI